MAYRSRYVGKYSGMGRMLTRPWLQAPCVAAAEKIKSAAEAVSPVGDPLEDRHPGRYRASFEVTPIYKNVPWRGQPRQRASARVINTTPYANIVEYGREDTPRYAPLFKGIEAAKGSHSA